MFDRPRSFLISASTERTFCWCRDGKIISAARFQADVAKVAERLPDGRYTINLCEDRYLFAVALLAAATRGQASLLPASRSSEDIGQAAATFDCSNRLQDEHLTEWIAFDTEGQPSHAADDLLSAIPDRQMVAVPFTSGSTGGSQPHPKHWGDLLTGARLAERRFGFVRHGISGIVATVPPQHMYGLEVSILVPIVTGVSVHAARPFFPADIAHTLAQAGPRPVLVTTPVHLSACVEMGLEWPPIAFIISATAPLSMSLATRAEACLGAPVLEIFGFTEAGSVASRRTVQDSLWQLYDGMSLRNGRLESTHLPIPVAINDIIEAHGSDRFALVGRAEDLVNVAGKRTSLIHLNRVLCEIEGVVDGAFFMPEEDSSMPNTRLAAAVVAPALRREQVLAALAPRIEPLFMPRPLMMIDRLPRNDNGKLSRRAILNLLQTQGSLRPHD